MVDNSLINFIAANGEALRAKSTRTLSSAQTRNDQNNIAVRDDENETNGPDSAQQGFFAFSLQGAIRTIEQNASQALNIHGSTSGQNVPGQSVEHSNRPDTPTANAQLSPTRLQESLSTTQISSPQDGFNQRAQALQTTPTHQSSSTANVETNLGVSQNLTNPVNTALVNSTLSHNTTAQNTNTRATQQSIAPTQNNPRINSNNTAQPNAQARPHTPPSAAQESFVRILATRISHGDTQFDIRLDPAELGRVDVKLNINENAKNSLTLRFENLATLELFRQDENNLRHILTEHYQNLDSENNSFDADTIDLNFTLSDEEQSQSTDQPGHHAIFGLSLPDETSPLNDIASKTHHSHILNSLASASSHYIDIQL